ncbi:hypothetical protein FQN49_007672 [Arthroderma sp. PD_2]|nr:hypothetical protein FQN49_007672 [Arthroderma sp. PD_2]
MELIPDIVKDFKLPVRFFAGDIYHHRNRIVEKWASKTHLGQGGFAFVYLQECLSDEEPRRLRAVKSILKPSGSLKSIDYIPEILAIANFSRPKYELSFVQLSGWYEDTEYVHIAMEYFEHGDLESQLETPLPEEEARNITAQLLEGLEHMHTNKFTHRDLKPKNILVASKGPRWWVKIGDFGFSKRVEGSNVLNSQLGTPYYMAPEIIAGNYTSAVDMWSLGVIVCRILLGPIPSPKYNELRAYILRSRKSPSMIPRPNHISGVAMEFLKGLFVLKPEKRLRAKDAMQHEWMKPTLPSQIYPNPSADYSDKDLAPRFSPTIYSSEFSRPSASWADVDSPIHISPVLQQRTIGSITGDFSIISKRAPHMEEVRATPLSIETTIPYKTGARDEGKTPGNQFTSETISNIQESAQHLYKQRMYEQAEIIFQFIVQEQAKILEPGHPDTLDSIRYFGLTLYYQEKLEEAEVQLQNAVDGYKKARGHDDPVTLESVYRLGLSLYDQEKWAQAEIRFQHAVDGFTKILGPDKLIILAPIHSLGLSLYQQEKWADAEIQFQHAVDGLERSLGCNHLDTLDSTMHLGFCLYYQNKRKEAEVQFQRAVNGYRKTRGRDHPDTLSSLSWLQKAQLQPKQQSQSWWEYLVTSFFSRPQ